MNAPVILPARTLHTLDPAHSGDAILIANGQIRSVGALDQLRVDHPEATVDDRYAEATILPGFVEAHAHSFAGGIWNYVYVGYFDNRDPDGRVWPG